MSEFSETYERLEFSPERQKLYGVSSGTAILDGFGNGYFLDDAGLASGMQIESHKNPNFDVNRPVTDDNLRSFPHFTDAPNAQLSAEVVQAKRDAETDRIEREMGELITIAADAHWIPFVDSEKRERYRGALLRAIHPELHARDLDKIEAVDRMAEGLLLIRSEGVNVPAIFENKMLAAVASFDLRRLNLKKQTETNEQRQGRLRDNEKQDENIKRDFRDKAAEMPDARIIDIDEWFVEKALQRHVKPGKSSVTYAYYHRRDPLSLRQLIVAQEGYERLYLPLMRPYGAFLKIAQKRMAADPDTLLLNFQSPLMDLEDLNDLTRIDTGYNRIADRYHSLNLRFQDQLLTGHFSEAVATAEAIRFLVRNKALEGEEPPEEWYKPLPGAPTGEPRRPLRTGNAAFDIFPKSA